jgi:two-component system, LytTR family, response regulator
MNAVIVDDELYCVEVLASLLQKHCPDVRIAAQFTDSTKAAEFLAAHPPDLLFVDIEMPRLNGFDLLHQLQPLQFQVIFTTAYNQYALRAIKLSALDYLLKPIDADELKSAVEKAQRQKSPPEIRQVELMENTFKSVEVPKKIALSTLEGLLFVDVGNIVHCQSDGSYTRLFLLNKEEILLSKSIKEVGELLTQCGFLRVHHSYLINLDHVERYIRGEGGEIILCNGHSVPVARSKKQEFLERVSKL